MFSFTFSYSRRLCCCCRQSADPQEEVPSGTVVAPTAATQEETPAAVEPVPEWPAVPEHPPVSNFAVLRSRIGDAGVFSALAASLSKWALEEAVEELWDADVLGVEVGGGDFSPRGEGNRDMGGVGESGDSAPCDPTDPAQPSLQLPLRRSREQNVLRLTRILGSLDLHIRSLDKYSSLDATHLRVRFGRVLRTVEDAEPGLMMGQTLV